jgi:hypothetical protein
MTISRVLLIHYDSIVAGSTIPSDQLFSRLSKASIKGKVIDQTAKGANEHLKKLAKRYLGMGKYYYRKSNHKRIILKIKPEKVMGLSIHLALYLLTYSLRNRQSV